MAVIYLPEDRRWSGIGQGIGDLVGTLVGQQLKSRDDARVLQGVTQIQAQAGDNPQDVPAEVAKTYGIKGIALYGALQKMAAQQGLAAQRNAATQLDIARLGQIPGAIEKQQAETERAKAGTAKEIGETKLLPLRAGEITAQTERAQAGTTEAQTQTANIAQQYQERKDQIDALAKMFTLSPEDQETVRKGIGVTPEQWHAIQLSATIGGPSAATKGIEAAGAAQLVGPKAAAAAQARRDVEIAGGGKPPPTQVVTSAAGAARMAQGLGETLSAVEQDPAATGGPLAWVKAKLTEQGFLQSDPMFAQLLANTHQLVVQAAQKGQFISGESIKLAKDISPSVQKGKVYSVLEANAIAEDSIAYLENLKMNYSEKAGYNTTSIDAAVGAMKKIADRTGSLWSTRMVDKENKQLPNQVLFYGGVQVDPKTLKPVKNGEKEAQPDKTYKLKFGPVSGEAVNARARELGITPSSYLAGQQSGD